ncbi:stress-response A/B barrel domain-containing protein DABB1-like [Humulus lupulus]|uniref:stress-response A/B barrel domain-containing protein DABB1-like n=1 Tax=Humulus lupulus TaxID=3486 RepID=UPI002B41845B|nr:stress-response A/B barrel domain-containing protein DABB1-like [Humulus lupulus]
MSSGTTGLTRGSGLQEQWVLTSLHQNTMSSSQNIEHVILFKLKDDAEPSEVKAAVNKIKGLQTIDEVLYLTAAPLRSSSNSSLAFTHVSHSRFRSTSELSAYGVHPLHLRMKKEDNHLIDDVLAVDWFTNEFGGDHVTVPPGSGVRVTLWKLKEGLGDETRSEILEGMRKIKEGEEVTEFTYGVNFSDRGKGFSMAILTVFRSESELEAADDANQYEKFKDYLDTTLVIEFVVPSQ